MLFDIYFKTHDSILEVTLVFVLIILNLISVLNK